MATERLYRIPALAWDSVGDDSGLRLEAITVRGWEFVIIKLRNDKIVLKCSLGTNTTRYSYYDTLEQAKAAAQEIYESEIVVGLEEVTEGIDALLLLASARKEPRWEDE
jgi:hypothetical protein